MLVEEVGAGWLAHLAGQTVPLAALEDRFTLDALVGVVGIILLGIVVGYIFQRYVVRYFEAMAARTDNDVDDRLVYFLRRFYKGILAFVVLLVVLKILQVEISPLLAGAGIAGVALAYASKDIISNFLAGVFLLIDQPIKIGDRIRIERIGQQWGTWGDVVDVGLRTTTVRNTDGVHVTYPNAKLADSVIKNFTPRPAPTRFRVRVLVPYDTNLQRAMELLIEVAQADDSVLKEPRSSVVLRSLYHDEMGHLHAGALLELRCFVEDIRTRTPLRSKLLLAIHNRFNEAGIRFAEPAAPPLGPPKEDA